MLVVFSGNPVRDSVKVSVPPGDNPPFEPPAQVGPDDSQTSTIWKLGKVVSRKVLKTAEVSDPPVASGTVLNPNAVSRSDDVPPTVVLVTVIWVVNVVVVPTLVNVKFENVSDADKVVSAPAQVIVLHVATTVNEGEAAVTISALATPNEAIARVATAATPKFLIQFIGVSLRKTR
jgi:hypothetical protein